MHLAAGEPDARRAVISSRAALEQDLDAERLHRGREQRGRAVVELALHQAVHEVHDGHRAAERREPVGGLEPEQAAADHDRALPGARRAIAAQSSGPRKTWACSAPGIGGTSASEPVQRTTRS